MEIIEGGEEPPPEAEPISAAKEGEGVIYGGGILFLFICMCWLCLNTPRLGFFSLRQPPYHPNHAIQSNPSSIISQPPLQSKQITLYDSQSSQSAYSRTVTVSPT